MKVLDRILGKPSADLSSGAVAKQRLTFVLQFDRARLSPGELELIKNDIIESISRHVEINREAVEVMLEPTGRLVVEIPLQRRPARPAPVPAQSGTRLGQ